MKVYNQEKTEIIENPDLEKGWLRDDKIVSNVIPATEAIPEKFHYEYKVYENGGRERFKIVDVEGVSAKPETYEYEDVKVFIPFTEEQLVNIELNKLTSWFEWYDSQMAQYNRCQRLGLEFDRDIAELDAEAVKNQLRIREINEELKKFEVKS